MKVLSSWVVISLPNAFRALFTRSADSDRTPRKISSLMACMSAGTQRVVSDQTIPSKEYGSPMMNCLPRLLPRHQYLVFPNIVDDGLNKVVFVYRPVC